LGAEGQFLPCYGLWGSKQRSNEGKHSFWFSEVALALAWSLLPYPRQRQLETRRRGLQALAETPLRRASLARSTEAFFWGGANRFLTHLPQSAPIPTRPKACPNSTPMGKSALSPIGVISKNP
jgi:hypothetical protein